MVTGRQRASKRGSHDRQAGSAVVESSPQATSHHTQHLVPNSSTPSHGHHQHCPAGRSIAAKKGPQRPRHSPSSLRPARTSPIAVRVAGCLHPIGRKWIKPSRKHPPVLFRDARARGRPGKAHRQAWDTASIQLPLRSRKSVTLGAEAYLWVLWETVANSHGIALNNLRETPALVRRRTDKRLRGTGDTSSNGRPSHEPLRLVRGCLLADPAENARTRSKKRHRVDDIRGGSPGFDGSIGRTKTGAFRVPDR